MHIFSPLMETKGQPFFGSSDMNGGYENGADTEFESCFSQCLASDDGADRKAPPAASSQHNEHKEPADSDGDRENFSPVADRPADQNEEEGTETDQKIAVEGKEHASDDGQTETVTEQASHDGPSETVKDKALQSLMQLLALLTESGSSNTNGSQGTGPVAITRDQARMLQRLLALLAKEEGIPAASQAGSSSHADPSRVSELLLGNTELLSRLRALLEKLDANDASSARVLAQMKSLGMTKEDVNLLRELLAKTLDRLPKTSGREHLAGQTAGEALSATNNQGQEEPVPQAEQASTKAGKADPWSDLRAMLNQKSVAQPGSGDEAASRTAKGSELHQNVSSLQHTPEEHNDMEQSRLVNARGSEKGDGRLVSRDSEQFKDMMGFKDKDGGASAGNKGQGPQAGETSVRSENMFSRTILDMDMRGEEVATDRRSVSRNILDQVQRGAFTNLGQGKKQLTLQLNPAHLGAVNVILQVRGKEVNAVLRTSHEDTSRVLGEQMVQLKEHLEKQGLRVVKLEVQNQMPSHDRPNQWNGGSEHNQSQEQFEANMRELRWRSLRGEGDGLAREMQILDHGANISPRGIDFFA
ncbi:flagellar hook-length control protein FliK [Desulfoplanes sp. PS50]